MWNHTPASLLDGDVHHHEEDPMKKAMQRFFRVALECAIVLLPLLAERIAARLRG